MHFVDPGVNPTSIHYFDEPSSFAAQNLYYIQSIGRFDVNAAYKVSRFNYNSFLLIVMTKGALCCHLDDQSVTAPAGAILLLDCHKPHAYYSMQTASFYFVHFNGSETARLYELIHDGCGLMIEPNDPALFVRAMDDILSLKAQGKTLNEQTVSSELYRMLMELLTVSMAGRYGADDKRLMENVTDYITRHLSDRLTVAQLAEHFGYSAGYFTCIFKRNTGFSPYQFILNCRLANSQHLLATTSLSVQEVADQSGFPNLANFSAAFRKAFNVTPSGYRRNPV